MFSIFEGIAGKIILSILALFIIWIISFLYSFTYWWRRGVFYLKPTLPFGNFGETLTGKQNLSSLSVKIYNDIKSKGEKYAGIYCLHCPVFFPTDPAIIKRILTVDFEYFNDRGIQFNREQDPLSVNLFGLPAEEWKVLRSKLSPAFTSGKMKQMFDITLTCADGIVEATERQINKPLEMNDLAMRYTVDNIARTAFGIECNTLNNQDEEFRKIGQRVITPPYFNGLKFLMSIITPSIVTKLNLEITEKYVKKFFLSLTQQNIDYRESNNIERPDFFQIILDMKKNDEKEQNSKMKMTPKLMAAQIFVFFAAGFDTSSTTIVFCLYELSKNPSVQDKVRREIKKKIDEHGGKLTYEAIKEMIFLDQCVHETLRKYPPLGFLNRECAQNYKIPDSNVILEKGTKVMISIEGLQNDPEYFPNPEKFDPERFSPENKKDIIPFTHIPFGEGQRICIGMRFGMMQTKVALAALLANFEYTLNPMTKYPFEFMPQSFTLSLKDEIYLNAKKI